MNIRLGKRAVMIFLTCTLALSTMTACSVDSMEISERPSIVVKVSGRDTLYKIASEYDADMYEIIEINDLDNPNLISVGQKLVIYPGEEYWEDNVKPTAKPEKSCEERWELGLQNRGYVNGINISEKQVNMDLENVLEYNDINFVMIKMNDFWQRETTTNGYDYSTTHDIKCSDFVEICNKKEVPFGVWFSPTLTDLDSTKQELDIVFSKLDNMVERGMICQMPICLNIGLNNRDLPERIKANDPKTLECFQYLADKFQEKNYCLMIYTSDYAASNYKLGDLANKFGVDLWLEQSYYDGQYLGESPNLWMDTDNEHTIREYSNGSILCYQERVKLNLAYKNFPEMIKANGLNGFEKSLVLEKK